MADDNSNYINYLPPVLWSRDADPQQLLGRMLRVFEKILTGIPDGNAIVRGKRAYNPLEQTIDELPKLFSPWRTQADFLPWLASWVALHLQENWSEYQRRKLISEIVSVYQLRGQKEGLLAYLDIFTVTEARPRIVVDDGDSIFRIVLHDRLSQVEYPAASGSPLVHPMALALDRQGFYIVADRGENIGLSENQSDIAASLWKLSITGEPSLSDDAVPIPKPIYRGQPLSMPAGLVVESSGDYVVVDAGTYGLYRFSATDPSKVKTIIDYKHDELEDFNPVDVALNTDGTFAILDRGAAEPRPAEPRIILVLEQKDESPEVDIYPLKTVWEPTAFAIHGEFFLVADAGHKSAPEPEKEKFRPADIYVVDTSSGSMQETSLLGSLVKEGENPLIYPTAILLEDNEHLLVADLGVKPKPVRRTPKQAEPAALYRVSLPKLPIEEGSTAQINLVSRNRSLVWPSDLVMDSQGAILLLDQGEVQDEYPERSWRTHTNEFGVIVYFCEDRPLKIEEQRKFLGSISAIVEAEKPAHTYWTLKSYELHEEIKGDNDDNS